MCGGSWTRARHCGSITSATICRESRAPQSFKSRDNSRLEVGYSLYMSDCLFCKIIAGEIKGAIAHQDDDLIAIKDINPQAPLHVLIIPRQHIATINDLTPANDALVGSMFRAAAALAKQHGYSERGYRTVFNCNSEAGQSVFHIHLHLLAGRAMTWPP